MGVPWRLMDITIVVPTKNASAHLEPLVASVVTSGLAPHVREVIFVNDGATDDTAQVLEDLRRRGERGDGGFPKVRVITFSENLGRFIARFRGAEAAQTQKILFLDSRLQLPAGFGPTLEKLAALYPSLSGNLDIDVSKSVFALYWDRSHRRLFSRHYRDTLKPLTLTPENYDLYLKGTTIFYCSRDLWVEACRKFEKTPLYSDDTYLMKEMVQTEPITIHPEIRIWWEPRDNWKKFLKALWDRGPGFAEYHVFERRGLLFWVVMSGLLALLAWLGLLIWKPLWGAIVFGVGMGLILLSAAAFARSPLEWIKIAPLHLGVICAYGFGALRGIWVIWKKKRREARGQFQSHAKV